MCGALRGVRVSTCAIRLFQDPKLFEAPRGSIGSSHIKSLLYTRPEFESGYEDILFLLLHCPLKTSNECVVEGMGSGINRFASTGRHLSPEQYSDCAKVHINGPKLHEADDFIAAAMRRRWPQTFGTGRARFERAAEPTLHAVGRLAHTRTATARLCSAFSQRRAASISW